jgi:hypothetical protein
MKKAAILWVLASGLFVATSASAQCVGDCNGDGTVAINELIIGVNIALGSAQVSACPSFDVNGDGMVTINELITAVNNALDVSGRRHRSRLHDRAGRPARRSQRHRFRSVHGLSGSNAANASRRVR